MSGDDLDHIEELEEQVRRLEEDLRHVRSSHERAAETLEGLLSDVELPEPVRLRLRAVVDRMNQV